MKVMFGVSDVEQSMQHLLDNRRDVPNLQTIG